MTTETEVKIPLGEDISMLRSKLKAMRAVLVSERHFEDNYVLDFPDGRLRSQQSMLRLRYTKDACFVTFKGPPESGPRFKIREELETLIGDVPIALNIFKRVGLYVWFQYQKYREEYELAAPERTDSVVHVSLDETPVGSYVELEGTQEGIRQAAASMGFDESQFLRASYYGLYLQFCREQGPEPGNMLFPNSRKTENAGKDNS